MKNKAIFKIFGQMFKTTFSTVILFTGGGLFAASGAALINFARNFNEYQSVAYTLGGFLLAIAAVMIHNSMLEFIRQTKSKNYASRIVEREINDIFSAYIYNMGLLLGGFLPQADIFEPAKLLRMRKSEMKMKLGAYEYIGFYIFKIQDDIAGQIRKIFADESIKNALSEQQLDILVKFSGKYREFQEFFRSINSIKMSKTRTLGNFRIKPDPEAPPKSAYSTMLLLRGDEEVHSADFRIVETEPLVSTYTLTNMAADEMSDIIYKSFKLINKWYTFCSKSQLDKNDYITARFRLFPISCIYKNVFFKENIFIDVPEK